MHASDVNGAVNSDGAFDGTMVKFAREQRCGDQDSPAGVAARSDDQPHVVEGQSDEFAAEIKLESQTGRVRVAPRTWRMSVEHSMRNKPASA